MVCMLRAVRVEENEMNEANKDAFLTISLGSFIAWFVINFVFALPFLAEKPLEGKCHTMNRIEYIFPGGRVGCEVGSVLHTGLKWLFTEPGK